MRVKTLCVCLTETATSQKTFSTSSLSGRHRFREGHSLLMQVPSNPRTWDPPGGNERAGGCRSNTAPGEQFCLSSYFSILQWSGALWFCSSASLSRAYYLTEWTSPRHVGDVSRSTACAGREPRWPQPWPCCKTCLQAAGTSPLSHLLGPVITDGFHSCWLWSARTESATLRDVSPMCTSDWPGAAVEGYVAWESPQCLEQIVFVQ